VASETRPAGERLTLAELAAASASTIDFVQGLTDLGIVAPEAQGFRTTDVYRVRFATLLVESGLDLETVGEAFRSGVVSFGDLETMFPEPALMTAMTHRALAEELGRPVDDLLAVRLAAGFADRAADDPVRSDEASILRRVMSIADGMGSPDAAPLIARMYGDRVARAAASALSLYRERVDRPWLATGGRLDPDVSRRGSVTGRRLIDETEQLMLGLYRRALDDAVLAGWLETTETLMTHHGYLSSRPERPPGIAFVDLSGFTRLTATDGDEVGTSMAMRLLEAAQRVAARHGVDIVKLLGDGVMLHADEPGRLLTAVTELVALLGRADLPPAHAGVNAGPLVERDGDYYGHAVNLAARIAGSAGPAEVLATAVVAEQAPKGMELVALPPRELRGIPEPVELFRVGPAEPSPAPRSLAADRLG
jgi:adenylate cyclase